ncbi:unnamed protein product [Diamesa tonsa]
MKFLTIKAIAIQEIIIIVSSKFQTKRIIMKIAIFVVIAFVAAVSAADLKENEATILDPSENVVPQFNDQGYNYNFKTSNNIERDEKSNNDIVTGEYSYIDSEGRTVKVTYTAGAGIGFNPKSDIIDPAIQAAVELNLKNPAEPEEPTKKSI